MYVGLVSWSRRIPLFFSLASLCRTAGCTFGFGRQRNLCQSVKPQLVYLYSWLCVRRGEETAMYRRLPNVLLRARVKFSSIKDESPFIAVSRVYTVFFTATACVLNVALLRMLRNIGVEHPGRCGEWLHPHGGGGQPQLSAEGRGFGQGCPLRLGLRQPVPAVRFQGRHFSHDEPWSQVTTYMPSYRRQAFSKLWCLCRAMRAILLLGWRRAEPF